MSATEDQDKSQHSRGSALSESRGFDRMDRMDRMSHSLRRLAYFWNLPWPPWRIASVTDFCDAHTASDRQYLRVQRGTRLSSQVCFVVAEMFVSTDLVICYVASSVSRVHGQHALFRLTGTIRPPYKPLRSLRFHPPRVSTLESLPVTAPEFSGPTRVWLSSPELPNHSTPPDFPFQPSPPALFVFRSALPVPISDTTDTVGVSVTFHPDMKHELNRMVSQPFANRRAVRPHWGER